MASVHAAANTSAAAVNSPLSTAVREADVTTLMQAVSIGRQSAVRALQAAGGDITVAMRSELLRTAVRRPYLAHLCAQYVDYVGVVIFVGYFRDCAAACRGSLLQYAHAVL